MEDKKVRLGCDATFSDSRASQKDLEIILLFVQERATDCQKSIRGGMPRPASSFGVKISFLGTMFLLLELMKPTIKSSICWMIFLLGRGRIAAIWVNFDKREVLAMLTLPKMVVLTFAHAKLSFLASLSALSQFWSMSVSKGFKLMPRSLKKGSVSREKALGPGYFSMGGLPKMTYFVFPTFIVRPDRVLNSWKILNRHSS